ncbi:hypothetical protein SBRCBS47491_001373 [Sporothrix bragantina]|uniref:Uncharacterized protein n=1 Tax=Sporothrix bragantina TaxID=671064 RepID=A0ABP0AXY4_9PEZI
MLSGLYANLRRGPPASIPSAAKLLPLLLLLTPSVAFPIPDAASNVVPDAAEEDPRRDLSKEHLQEKVNIVVARYELYTTTWTETETYTSTYTSGDAAAPTGICTPVAGSGQIACGNVCCGSWQYCAYQGQCLDIPGATVTGGATTVTPTPTGKPTYFTTYTTTGGVTVTTPYNPPYKATSGSGSATGTAVGASGSGTGVTSTTSGNHLSGGAIAGIVIGTLAGIGLLILLCACVLVRGLWHGILAIFGLGGNRRRDKENVTIIEEERYHHHGGGREHSSWYGGAGGGGGRPPPPMSEKKSSGRGWLGLGAAAGTILLLLGLKRHKDHKEEERRRPPRSRSDVSSDYYTYSGSYLSGSRDSRRSRGTRASRRSDPTRVSRSSRPSRQSRAASRR